MEVSSFTEKLNKVDGNTYVIEEEVQPVGGVYEALLAHDNINTATLSVWTGPKLTGKRIESYVLSTPGLTPWKRSIRLYSDAPVVYISYETDGDTVEAEDINLVQEKTVETQAALNAEEKRAKAEEERIAADLANEMSRAERAEAELAKNLQEETARAEGAERVLTENMQSEVSRAMAAEKANADHITAEAERAKTAELELQNDIKSETSRAVTAEDSIRDTITTNKPNWDDKYTRNEVDNKFSALETAIDWKEAVDTFSDISVVYPKPEDGWTVNVKDTDYTYRWNGTVWIAISANAIPKATHSVDGILSKEDKAAYDDANSRKHIHNNKSILDKITQAVTDNWNMAYTHVSDTIKHITVLERTNWNDADSKKHTHSNKSILDGVTQALLDAWNTVGNKVDKVSGKGLSANDYTTAEKTKLSGIAAGAEVNIQSDWAVKDSASDAYIKNIPSSFPPAVHTHTKSQITDMPAKLSQFANDTGYITAADVDTSQNHTHANKTVLDKITQALLDNWNAAYTHVSDAVKHVTAAERTNWNTVTNKVDKVSGKQLSTNDYTAAEKNKLTGIAAGANNYVHPTTTGNKHIPAGGASGQFLKWSADGSAMWAADNNTTYSVFKAATASAAGGTGLVPAPAAGAQAKYLRADGTWQTPPNTSYSVATQTANGLMAAADKKKLDGVAAGANNYVHPSAHPASMITQDATHRFTTDTEKAGWNKILFSAAVTVPASDWSTSVPYTQTVSVSELTAAMDVMLGLNITGSPSAASVAGWKKALGMIDEGTTANGTITFKCYSKKPAIDIPVFIKSV